MSARMRVLVRSFVWVGLCLSLPVSADAAAPSGRLRAYADKPPAERDPRLCNLPHTNFVYTMREYKTLPAWLARKDHLRKQILVAAGLWPMPEKTPLKAVISGRIERSDYTVERAYFESRPGFYVTGNLYRPKNVAGKVPGVLCPHGHWKHGRLEDSERGSVPARSITLARLGCTVFTYDMAGYNDSARQIKHDFGDERGSLWGLGTLGLQLWNSIRAVDFLQSLPEVDPDRIGCTGASGGGTQTFTLSAVDDRIKVAAPVNMISSTMQGGCPCENAPCLRIETNNMEIGAMMAPRPLLMVSATGDWTKLTPTVEYPAVRSIYRLYGADDRVRSVQIDAGHNYNKLSREAMYQWFGRHLLGLPNAEKLTEPEYAKEPDEQLRVFGNGDLPAGAVNPETLAEQIIAASKRQLQAVRKSGSGELAGRMAELRTVWRYALGVFPPSGLDDVRFESVVASQQGGIVIGRGVLVRAGRSVRIPALSFASAKAVGGQARACLLVHPKGKAALLDAEQTQPGPMIRRLVEGGLRVMAIDVFGIDEAKGQADPKQPRGSTGFFTTFNRTDAAERAWDVATALAYLASRSQVSRVTLVGLGEAGPWCLLGGAAAGAPLAAGWKPVSFLIDADAFDAENDDAYLERLYVPHIRRAGGLEGAAAQLAPARLLLHHAGEKFPTDWLRSAYAAVGESDRLDIETDALGEQEMADRLLSW